MAQNDQNYIKRGEIYFLEKFQNFRLKKCLEFPKNILRIDINKG